LTAVSIIVALLKSPINIAEVVEYIVMTIYYAIGIKIFNDIRKNLGWDSLASYHLVTKVMFILCLTFYIVFMITVIVYICTY